MPVCHGVCNHVDECNNDVNKIMALVNSRNSKTNINDFIDRELPFYSAHYRSRCTTCEIFYLVFGGIRCPCCGNRVRTRSRSEKKLEDIIEPEPVILVRSHVGYSSRT